MGENLIRCAEMKLISDRETRVRAARFLIVGGTSFAVQVAVMKVASVEATSGAEAEAAKIGVGVSRLAQVMGWECICG